MRLIIVLLSCLFAMALPAVALADNEPNDGIGQWEGPYAGDVTVNGTFPVDNDVDWYGFYATGPGDVTVPVQNLGQAGTCRPVATMRDPDGHPLASVSPDSGQTSTLILNALAGTNRYFLTLEAGCNGGAYAFTLTPAAAIATGAKRTSPTIVPEPNDSLADAFGPLPGGVSHGGGLENDGDEDWYFVYTSDGPQTIDASLTNTSPTTACAPRMDLLPGEGGTSFGQVQVDKDTIGHLSFTAPSAQKVAVRVRSNCSGGSYALQVDPPSALSQDEPEGKGPAGPTQACKNARTRVKSLLKLVKKRNKELKKAKTTSGKKKAKAKRKAVGRQLDKARDKVVQEC